MFPKATSSIKQLIQTTLSTDDRCCQRSSKRRKRIFSLEFLPAGNRLHRPTSHFQSTTQTHTTTKPVLINYFIYWSLVLSETSFHAFRGWRNRDGLVCVEVNKFTYLRNVNSDTEPPKLCGLCCLYRNYFRFHLEDIRLRL